MKKFSELPFLARLGIIAAAGAAIVAAGEYLWLGDMRAANDELHNKLTKLKEDNDKVRPIEQKFKQIKVENEQLEQQLVNLRNIVPEEKEADAFIRMVQEASAQSGVAIRRFTAKPTAQKEFYVEMPFDLALDGNFFSVLQFFDRMGKLSRISNISNLNMGPTTGSVRGVGRRYRYSPSETVLASCTATTFYSREAPAAPAKK